MMRVRMRKKNKFQMKKMNLEEENLKMKPCRVGKMIN